MKKKEFIKCVSRRIHNGQCDLFIGSGVSCESGIPSWKKLLQPMAKDLKIDLHNHDNLLMIAQYIVNENLGNRNVLKNRLIEIFHHKIYNTNQYHRAIQNMNVNSIWTTNYDCLIEDAMSAKKYCVISNDDDLGKLRSGAEEMEIIKIHGSIDGNINDIVLTQQDYDEFLLRKPAIAQRLRDTLIKKSVFFIGYGYNDPDIRTIMIEAMKLIQNNFQDHYIILLDTPSNKNHHDKKQDKLRFEMWKKELNRIGIRELVVKSNSEMAAVLNEISLRSRGRNVFITGSHKSLPRKNNHKLGKLLAQDEKIKLINGQSDGIGMQVLQGFMQECIVQKKDLGTRMQLYPNPYAANPNFENNKELLPKLKKERSALMTDVKVFAFFKGGIGTKAEYEIAHECGCLILPLIVKKEDYKDSLISEAVADEKCMKIIKKKAKFYYKILKNKKKPKTKQIVKAIRRMVI